MSESKFISTPAEGAYFNVFTHEDMALPRFGAPVGPWHPWFAWKPVWTWNEGWTWLRSVYRRRIQLHDHITQGAGADSWWQYSHPNSHVPPQAAMRREPVTRG